MKRKPIEEKAGVVAYRPAGEGGIEALIITARNQKWIFPVGTVDPGETLQQTAARECEEESGYIVKVGRKLETIYLDKESSTHRLTFFVAQIISETKPEDADRQRQWVQLSDLVSSVANEFQPVAYVAIAYFCNNGY